MVRNVVAVVVGLAVGMVVNMALVMLNVGVLFPMPEGTSMADPDRFAAYLADLPATAFLVAVAAHLGQAFVGGWTAARLGASHPVVLALIVGGLTLVGGVINLIQLPGPAWMWLEVPLYLLVALAAGRREQRRRATP